MTRIRSRRGALTLIFCFLVLAPSSMICLALASPGNRLGPYVTSESAFPTPAGTVEIPISEGDFEVRDKPPNWPAGGEVVTSADAPQGGGTRGFLPTKAGS